MANRGYDAVVDVDIEGDLGHTDLQEDLEFHSSNFDDPPSAHRKTASTSLPPFGSGGAQSSSGGGSGGGAFASKRYLWSLAFYARFFDVDTTEVVRRCQSALYPRASFLDVLDGNADLYGPFWIATTIVFILFLAGNVNKYLSEVGAEHTGYSFALLSAASGLVYGYTFLVPVALWGVLRWFGSEAAGLLDCWALYGYANLVWVPVALASWSTLDALNWAFVALGFAASALFLVRNLWPLVNAADRRVARVLPFVVVALHVGLAATIKFTFFGHYSPIKTAPSAGEGGNKGEGAVRMLSRAMR